MIDHPLGRRDFLKGTGALGAITLAGGGLEAFLAACGNETQTSTTSGQPVHGGALTVATVDTPPNIDPQDAELYSSIQVYHNIFSRLVEIDANFKYHPSLATKWTQEDAKTWTVDLVENAVF